MKKIFENKNGKSVLILKLPRTTSQKAERSKNHNL